MKEWERREQLKQERSFDRTMRIFIVVAVLGGLGFSIYKALEYKYGISDKAVQSTVEIEIIEVGLPDETFVGPQQEEQEEVRPTLKKALREKAKKNAKEAWWKFWK